MVVGSYSRNQPAVKTATMPLQCIPKQSYNLWNRLPSIDLEGCNSVQDYSVKLAVLVIALENKLT